MSSGRHFFATANDLIPGFRRFEQARAVQYVLTGHFDSPKPTVFTAGEALPELGRAPAGDASRVPAFLVLTRDAPVAFREIPQSSGGMVFAVDQLQNPDSTVFRAGGVEEESVLISGEIATTGVTLEALEVHRLMVRTVTKGFRRVRSFWLGPEAFAMFAAGARLTQSVSRSRLYDLPTDLAD
jgi:hypothetical protein